ncbi:phospholipase A2 inhibitor-like [Strongylocentrotus purpuratus]|uniref:Ig-like domain-containing protein n=1 Tax=Strongylocentrotus purpuratus TaxID=7668 RepID=A0A7M7SYL9_STRPU|nr:phospholipase A2 inhibitor-like [Strongylocentrotus purpuratus]
MIVEFIDQVVLDNGSFTNSSFSDLYFLTISGVEYIKPGGFRAVAGIRQLIFSGMLVAVLEKSVFMYLNRLEGINADNNNINVLKDGCFGGLDTELHNLSLANNSIWGVSRDNFIGLSMLQKLVLSKNNIAQLGPQTFELMPELLILNLASNAIVRIEQGAFLNLNNLEMLYLDGNQIQVLPEPQIGIAIGFREVTVILHSNPLQCDCRMDWISTWQDIVGKHCSGTCQLPEKFKGHTLVTAYRDPLPQCRDNNSEIHVATGSMATLTCPIAYASWVVPGNVTLQKTGQSDDHYFLTNRDSLVVWNTQLQQEGVYECMTEDGDQLMVYNLSVHMSAARITIITVFVILVILTFVSAVFAVRYCCRRCHRSQNLEYENLEDQQPRGEEPQHIGNIQEGSVANPRRDHLQDDLYYKPNGDHIKPDEQTNYKIKKGWFKTFGRKNIWESRPKKMKRLYSNGI